MQCHSYSIIWRDASGGQRHDTSMVFAQLVFVPIHRTEQKLTQTIYAQRKVSHIPSTARCTIPIAIAARRATFVSACVRRVYGFPLQLTTTMAICQLPSQARHETHNFLGALILGVPFVRLLARVCTSDSVFFTIEYFSAAKYVICSGVRAMVCRLYHYRMHTI